MQQGKEKKRIIIGSCYVYVSEFTGKVDAIAEIIKTVCVEEKRLGYIKGGAAAEYKPTFYTAKDDMGLVSKSTITDEEALVKSGIMTIGPDMLNILTATGRVSDITDENTKKGYKLLKIGGIANNNGKSYVLVFHHEDKVDGDIYLIIVGKNEAGFTIQFQKDKETVVDAEFKCLAQDDEGTLISYVEEVVSSGEEEAESTSGEEEAEG